MNRTLPARIVHARTTASTLVLLALTTLVFAGPAQAFTLVARTDYATGPGPYNVTVTDLNGDGIPDLVVPCFSANTVSVFLGAGGGRLSPRTDLSAGAGPTAVAVGDLNGDGHPDMAVVSQTDGALEIFMGTGNGSFAPGAYGAVGGLACAVVIGDFNEDGRPDLAVCLQGPSQVMVLFNDSHALFGARTAYAVGSTPVSLVAGDFNGDGHLDLAVANHNSNSITILHGDGTGAFGTPATLPVTGPTSIAAADLNQNGSLDLVAASITTDSVSVWLSPVESNPRTDRGIGAALQGVAIGRLQSSTGPTDIALAEYSGSSAAVLNGDNGGGFSAPALFATGAGVSGIAVADMNGDGLQDIITANNSSNSITVLINGTSNGLQNLTEYLTGNLPQQVLLADLNRDGRLDAVVGNTANTTVSVLLGDGAGGFGPKTDFSSTGGAFGIALADFNGDGILDLATADGGFNELSVAFGNGAGGFGTHADYATGTFPAGIVAADLNHDGRPDLVTVNSTTNNVSVLLNNGAGTFAAKTDYAAGSSANWIATGDLNGDGNPDIVVTNGAANTTSVLLGNGTGGLNAQVSVPAGTSPYGVSIGDLNGDGKPDLVVSNSGAATVSVLLNNGSGTSYTRTDYAVGPAPRGSVIVDQNGDGIPDLVVCNSTGSSFSILYGTGGGAFSSALATFLANSPYAPATGDLNADGKPDLVMTENSPGKLAVYLGKESSRTALTVTPNLCERATTATWKATVSVASPGTANPTGLVYFYDGTTYLGNAPVSGGVASFGWWAFTNGVRSPSAVYVGDGRVVGSLSPVITQRVVQSASARVTKVADIPNDQGGQVRLNFFASPFDVFQSALPIARYDVFRRGIVVGSTRLANPNQAELAGWDFVASVPANGETEYDVVAPTVADSNGTGFHRAVFLVRASTATPAVYYDSLPDSGYSVDNLPPAPPSPFLGAYSGGATHLHWGPNTEHDFWYYALYRGASSGFVPGPGNFVATLSDTGYSDLGPAGSWYKLAAVDANGNVSAYSTLGPGGTSEVGPATPVVFALEGARPNPARGPGLVIRFALPSAEPARLTLVDVGGREVATRDVGAFGAGEHAVDLAQGRTLAPGVYLVRLTQGAEARTSRVAMLR